MTSREERERLYQAEKPTLIGDNLEKTYKTPNYLKLQPNPFRKEIGIIEPSDKREGLQASIEGYGLLPGVLLTPAQDEKGNHITQIVYGHGRIQALIDAGRGDESMQWDVTRHPLSDADKLRLMIIENAAHTSIEDRQKTVRFLMDWLSEHKEILPVIITSNNLPLKSFNKRPTQEYLSYFCGVRGYSQPFISKLISLPKTEEGGAEVTTESQGENHGQPETPISPIQSTQPPTIGVNEGAGTSTGGAGTMMSIDENIEILEGAFPKDAGGDTGDTTIGGNKKPKEPKTLQMKIQAFGQVASRYHKDGVGFNEMHKELDRLAKP